MRAICAAVTAVMESRHRTQLLAPRRLDDDRPIFGQPSAGCRRTSRAACMGTYQWSPPKHPADPRIDQNVKINRALWMLAEGMRQMKA